MKRLFVVAALSVALLAGCKGDPEKAANKLFVEAMPLWQQYQTLPADDSAQYDARLKLLTQVDENLKSILQDYPESSLAVELVSTGSLKQLDKEKIEQEIPRLQQSIPASALMAETLPLWTQYQALPTNDPAQYAERLKLLTQVDANLDKLLKDYPLSYEVERLPIDAEAVKAEVPRLQQSIPASALMAETLPLWTQYQALPTNDPAQYDARLKLLTQVDANLGKLLTNYPLSYEVERLPIDAEAVRAVLPILQRNAQCTQNSDMCAKTTIAIVMKMAEGIKGDPDRSMVFAAITTAQASSGDVEGALKTARDIKGDTDRATALAAIATAQASSGDVAGAKSTISMVLKVAEGITGDTYRATAFAAIATAQASSGDVEGALTTVESIIGNLYRAKGLAAIATVQASSGEVEDAKSTIVLALKAADGITLNVDSATALAAIATAQASSGEEEGAKSTIVKAMKLAEDISYDTDREKALAAIATAQASSGDVAGALKTVESIKGYFSRAPALATIASAQVSSGDVAGAKSTIVLALKAADGITYNASRATALAAIATVLAKQK